MNLINYLGEEQSLFTNSPTTLIWWYYHRPPHSTSQNQSSSNRRNDDNFRKPEVWNKPLRFVVGELYTCMCVFSDSVHWFLSGRCFFFCDEAPIDRGWPVCVLWVWCGKWSLVAFVLLGCERKLNIFRNDDVVFKWEENGIKQKGERLLFLRGDILRIYPTT